MKKLLFTGVVALGIAVLGVSAFAVDVPRIVWPVDTMRGNTVKPDGGDGSPPGGPTNDACPDVALGALTDPTGTIAADTTGMDDDWDDNTEAWRVATRTQHNNLRYAQRARKKELM
ncbi:MAG: hypothetical protein IID43_01260 [Planctomycetes bacterium]|nr:hypothetical protein [Planctomycetota bacterium]